MVPMMFDILMSALELAGFLGAVAGFHTVTDDQAWDRLCRWLRRCARCGRHDGQAGGVSACCCDV